MEAETMRIIGTINQLLHIRSKTTRWEKQPSHTILSVSQRKPWFPLLLKVSFQNWKRNLRNLKKKDKNKLGENTIKMKMTHIYKSNKGEKSRWKEPETHSRQTRENTITPKIINVHHFISLQKSNNERRRKRVENTIEKQ